MKAGRLKIVSFGTALLLAAGLEDSAAQDVASVEQETWRFEYDNDFFFDKDNKVTSRLSLQRHTAVAESWDALRGVPRFSTRIGSIMPTLTKEGLSYRIGMAVEQVIQTPTDLSRRDLIEDDVPYAGVLALQLNWYGYNDSEYRGFNTVAGVVGPLSLARQAQFLGHKVSTTTDPKGWDNQLPSEPVFNCGYMRKKKFCKGGDSGTLEYDAAFGGDAGLGNLVTQIGGTLELRLGRNMPQGFASVSDPASIGTHHAAVLAPSNSNVASAYAFLVLGCNAYAYNIFLDGNAFRDSHSVDKEILVAKAMGGIRCDFGRWGIQCGLYVTTDNVDTHQASEALGNEQLGTLILEWRF